MFALKPKTIRFKRSYQINLDTLKSYGNDIKLKTDDGSFI